MPKPITIPKEAASDVPPGLCHYELQKHLGIDRYTMKLWCFYTGYEPVDGRSKYHDTLGQSLRYNYRPILESGVGKTLEEIGKELGITRERVRQLYIKYGIKREVNPHSLHKNQELVNKIRALTETCPTSQAIADASGLSITGVGYILRRLNIPFKNARKRRNEEEAATGLRVCSKCHQPKPLSQYYKHSNQRGGRLPWCKVCHYQRIKDWRIRTGRQSSVYGRRAGHSYDPVTDLPWPHGYKQCNVCKKVKLWDEFHRATKDRTGHVGYCKDCKRIADANRPKVKHEPVMVGDKLCRDCGKAKPIVEFSVTRSNQDGRTIYCKACLAIRAHKNYQRKRGMKPTRVYRKRALKRAAKPTGRVYNSVDELVAEMPATIQKKYHELGQQFGLTAEQINKLKEGKV